MSRRKVSTEEVLHYLGVRETRFIESLRAEGLFEEDELEPAQAEELRLAIVLTHELGVNPAGVEVVLHLRRRMDALERRAEALARVMHEGMRGGDDSY